MYTVEDASTAMGAGNISQSVTDYGLMHAPIHNLKWLDNRRRNYSIT